MIGSEKTKTISAFAEIVGAVIPAGVDGGAQYQRILTQSVYAQPGDIVISGKWYAKEQTVSEALEKGAVAVFCDYETKKKFPEENVIPVEDPLECVLRYEKWRAQACHAKRIAITGSVGKTTTTGLINAVIANSFNTLTHHSMSNSHGAILRNVQRLQPDHEYWVQEVGGVQPGYVESSAQFLRPDIVVLTNIGESHLNLYGTKENIMLDKSSLERYAQQDGVVIISHDDDILRNTQFSHRRISCSLNNAEADYYAEDIRLELDGTHFTAVCREGKFNVHLNLYGEHNVYNALFAIAVGREANVPMPRIVELLEKYYPDGMRQNLIKVGGYTIFLDAFNAEPKTVLGAAITLTQMPKIKNGRKIFVTGHIDKLGVDSPRMHSELGHELSKLDLDLVILFAGDSKYTYQAMLEDGKKNMILMTSRERLDDWLHNNLTREDIVFFKSGQFEAALAKTVDHVFGTCFQNEQQFNNGTVAERDGYKFRIRQDKIAEIIGYTGGDKDLVLPAAYGENTVIRIAPNAFTRNKKIKSIVIPDTVTHIGKGAFYICPNLKYVKMPSNLRYIDDNAFNYCRALEEVVLPNGTIHIGRRAFYDCDSLKSIFIPSSVGFLGDKVFGTELPHKRAYLRIVCPQGSYAEEYAKLNNIDTNIADRDACEKIVMHVPKDNALTFEKLAELRPKDAARIEKVKLARKRKLDKCDRIYNYVKEEIGCEASSLTDNENKQLVEMWGDLIERGIINTRWAALYKQKTGEFRPDYIGNDFHIYFAEEVLNDSGYIRGLCDKNIMPLVTPAIKHPKTLLSKLNGIYVNENYDHVSESAAIDLLYERKHEGAVIKQCRSSGGKGVVFVSSSSTKEDIRNALTQSPYVTVQAVVRQHPEMAKMNPSSVNTIRIMTILANGESVIVSCVVRIGSTGSKVDNFHSGGVSCGVNEDGTLKPYACDVTGKRVIAHDNGFVFAGAKIPSFDKVCSIVKKLHYMLPVFGIISWDICVDELGDPVLIEYNIGGGITVHQLSNGPLYGKYRQQVVSEVLNRYSEERAVFDYSYIWNENGVKITQGSTEADSIDIPGMIDKRPLLSIEKEAFLERVNLKEITINGELKSIGFAAFYKCRNLKSVSLTGKVAHIERSAFNSCSSLKSFCIPDGTRSIGKYAFAYNPALREIIIPNSVIEIAPDAFFKTPNLTIVCEEGTCAEVYAKKNGIRVDRRKR